MIIIINNRVLSWFCIIRSFAFSPSTQQNCKFQKQKNQEKQSRKTIKKKKRKRRTTQRWNIHKQSLTTNNGWSYFGKFNPARQINKTLQRSVLRQKTRFELQVSCGEFGITLRMQPWSWLKTLKCDTEWDFNLAEPQVLIDIRYSAKVRGVVQSAQHAILYKSWCIQG